MSLAIFFDYLQAYLANHELLAPILYTFFHIIFAVCIIPCSPMAIIAGVLWGKWLGLGISICAAFLSTCVTFGLSRLFFRDKIYNFLVKKYKKTDWVLDKTKQHGWKFVASVQLNPVLPGSTLGYIFGLTKINFLVYALFCLIFMLPLQILLVMCGDNLSGFLLGKTPWLIMIALLIITLYIWFGAKRERQS
jgi:uncharacterized membrane protein YdjX (TVP38/TMEM64 family)